MRSELRFRFWVYLLTIGLCILCDTRCATSQGGGQAKAEVIAVKVENAKRVLNNPNATPDERRQAARDLDEAANDARWLGKQNDETHEVNSDLMRQIERLKPYRNFLIAAGVALSLFIFWRLR